MRISSLFTTLFALLMALSATATPPAGYYLVWGDEFSGTNLDSTKWAVWNQTDRSGFSSPIAVTVGGGYMTIHTFTSNGVNYSAIVTSDPNFRERFGYSEASVEFNGSPGMFSDFWMNSAVNGDYIGDPAAEGAELDFCEHRVTTTNNQGDLSGQVTIDLHWDGYTQGIEHTATSGLVGSGLGAGFHTYGGLWTSSNYVVSIDGIQTWTTNAGVSAHSEVIMFSSEVDSNSFCGVVPAGGYGNFLVSTTTTVVDYLRFYAPTTTLYWLGASSANWSDTGNWLSNMAPASASDAVFSYLSVGNCNINLGQNTTVNSLSIQESPPVSINGSNLTVNGGGIDMFSALYNATINSPLVLGAAQPWSIGATVTLIDTGGLSGPGNLTLSGQGQVILQGPNTASGTITISNGTLSVSSALTNQVVVAGGTLAGTGAVSGPVFVNAGTVNGAETISGPVVVNGGTLNAGTITGPVVVNAYGSIAPGMSTGALVIHNSLALQPGSQTSITVNKTAGTCGQITGLSSITFGGTLLITNQSGTLAPGDSFNVFQAGSYSGAFNRISPPTPGSGLAWDTSLLDTSGIIRVITTASSLITAQLTGSQLAISWSSNNIGWLLQSQTNTPGGGITTNWVAIAASATTNLMAFAIHHGVGSVFYRLVSPSFSTAIFASGDLIVLQVGNGSISTSGAPGVLQDYSPFGGASQAVVNLPTTGSQALIFGGSSYEGTLSLSADGQSVVVGGYHIAVGGYSGTIDTSSTTGSPAVPRGVGWVNAQGTFTLVAMTTEFSGGTIRSAAADGNGNFWAGGGNSGIVYLGNNSPAAVVSTVSTSTRNAAIFNGNLYFTEDGSGVGVMGFSGLPRTGATPALVMNTSGTGSGPSPTGLAINSAATIAYVADNRAAGSGGGIQRFNWANGAWVYAYTLANQATSSQVVYDLAVNFTGTNPVLYATTGESTANYLITASDTGANSTFSILETAPSGNAFRGVVLAP